MTDKTKNTETFIDPVCGMQVDPARATGSINQDGETYYFCSAGCLQKFIAPDNINPTSCCSGN